MVRMIGKVDSPSSPSQLPPIIETTIDRLGEDDGRASMISGRREGACKLGDILVIRPHNLGWLETRLQPAQLEFIWERIAEAKGVKDAKPTLAGIIDQSWELKDKDDWFFMNVLDPLITRYQQEFDNIGHNTPVSLKHPYHLNTWWVNYQKETEFQPPHEHYGVWSFVIWLKIPTDFHEQNQNPIAANSNHKLISAFEFYYLDLLGKIKSTGYNLSPAYEGTMLLFPSDLKHAVHPYYNCKEDRISISGNIALDSSKVMPSEI